MADSTDLGALRATQAEVTALIALLLAGIKEQTNILSEDSELKHNPLGVLHTASMLLRSQATHIGLLSITSPFTPSAITSTLRTTAKVLPAFAAALEDARHPRVPRFIEKEARTRVRSLLDAVRGYIASIPRDSNAQAEALSEDARDGMGSGERRVLRGTGVIWESCDWFIEAGASGVRWLATTKLRAWKELVDDAAEEIGEWLEMDPEEDDAEGSGSESEDDDIFGANTQACPPSLQPIAQNVQEHITHLRKLYAALRTVVISQIPKTAKQTRPEDLPDVHTTQRVDSAFELAVDASREVDELVAGLYATLEETHISTDLARVHASIEQQATAILGAQSSWVQEWKALRVHVES